MLVNDDYKQMYSGVGKSTNSKLQFLLKSITKNPLKLENRDGSIEKLKLCNQRHSIHHHKKIGGSGNQILDNSEKSVICMPKINNGTSSFLSLDRKKSDGIFKKESPDHFKYKPQYTTLYAHPKLILPWNKITKRPSLFEVNGVVKTEFLNYSEQCILSKIKGLVDMKKQLSKNNLINTHREH